MLTLHDPEGSRSAVTVLLPTYNAARTVGRAIDSVLAQTWPHWSLICIDDASQDGSVACVETYGASLRDRLQVIRLGRNVGPAAARNQGLAAARGDWIAVLDADDAWHPERLERLLTEAGRTGADLVCDNLLGFDDHRGQVTEPLFPGLPPSLDISVTVAAEYRGRYNLGYLKPLLTRSFVEKNSIRYDEALRTGEDLLFLLECLAAGARSRCLGWPGYIYTTPVGHASRRLSRSTSTSPRDVELAAALDNFALRSQGNINRADLVSVEQRITYLGDIAPLANFRHARLNGDWATALRLLVTEPRIRQQIWTVLRTCAGLPDRTYDP